MNVRTLKRHYVFLGKSVDSFLCVPLLLLDSIQTGIKVKMVSNPKNC